MNTISNVFGSGLRSRVAVYIPSTVDAVGSAGSLSEKMTETAAARLSELFGGATISLAAGAWMSAEHGLIREQVTIVYSYCTEEQLEQAAQEVRSLAEMVRDEMRQEAVSVEINNTLYFI